MATLHEYSKSWELEMVWKMHFFQTSRIKGMAAPVYPHFLSHFFHTQQQIFSNSFKLYFFAPGGNMMLRWK
jgi:hypothetical protein